MHLGWQAKQRPDAIAVIESGGRTVTNAELDAWSRQPAAPLDLRSGDAIAIRMPSGAHLYLTDRAEAADVAVIGVPDPERGERVLAVVQPAAADVTADELLADCRERLAPYKCPRAVDFVLSLPRDPSGTLRKGLLRETYWRNHETRIV
ncbi:hypothetical protein ABZ402_10965 [Streptomyces mirabilis]|uniref:AMP-binding enzyme n=1 Tax=Streptomyces mirabilis TaxID=68239 RepID=UPI0033EBB6FE